jgi:dTDP-4-amino-4,6-dideoxygalactose transaminase
MSVTSRRAIPYVNLAAQHQPLKAELLRAVGNVLDEGQFILGPAVSDLESQFARLCGTTHAIGVNSGMDALVLALRALDIGEGDEVITAPNSFVASTSCIRLAGARPVFADVGDDYNLDPAQVARAITPRTRAILPIHLTGRPCDMDALLEIAAQHRLAVVEDCAQAVMAEYKGRRVGSFGAFGCFSLHPLKNLNACGDGGVLTTNDTALYEKLLVMRNLGLRTRDDCTMWSGNSRLDTMQAAIVSVKLRHLHDWTRRRRENAAFYRRALSAVDGIRIPVEAAHTAPVYHTFVVQAERRDELRTFLAARDIGTAIHYPVPIHLSTAGQSLGYARGSFPVTEHQASRILSLPIYPELTEDDLGHVTQAIGEFYQ